MTKLDEGKFTNSVTVQRVVADILAGLGRTLDYYGAKGDVVRLSDGGAIESSSQSYTNAGASFTAADVGKDIRVAGAGSGGTESPDLLTTIAAYVSATAVTLADAAGTTVTDAATDYGTDDSAAFQAAFNDGVGEVRGEPGKIYNVSSVVYMLSDCVISNAHITCLSPFSGGIFRIDGETGDIQRFGFRACRFHYIVENWVAFFCWLSTQNIGYTNYDFSFNFNTIRHRQTYEDSGDNWCIVLRNIEGASISWNALDGAMQLVAGGGSTDIRQLIIDGNRLRNSRANAIALSAQYASGTGNPAPVREDILICNNVITDDVGNNTGNGIFIGLDGSGGKGGPARPIIIRRVVISDNTIRLTRAFSAAILIRCGVTQTDYEEVEAINQDIVVSGNVLDASESMDIKIDGDNATQWSNALFVGNEATGRVNLTVGGWNLVNNDIGRVRFQGIGGRLVISGGELSSLLVEDTDEASVVVSRADFRTTGASYSRSIDLDAASSGSSIEALITDCSFEGLTEVDSYYRSMVRSKGDGSIDAIVIRPLEKSTYAAGRFESEDGQPTPVLIGALSIIATSNSPTTHNLSSGDGIAELLATSDAGKRYRVRFEVLTPADGDTTTTVELGYSTGTPDVDAYMAATDISSEGESDFYSRWFDGDGSNNIRITWANNGSATAGSLRTTLIERTLEP